MNNKKSTLIVLLLGVLQPMAVLAEAQTKYSINLGAILLSDGSTVSDEDYVGASLSMPISLGIKTNNWKVNISTSYLRQDQDDGTTDAAFGDLNVSLSHPLSESLTLRLRHKFATGDEVLGFSSGDDDNTISVDYFYLKDFKTAYFATISHKFVGKEGQTDRQDSSSFSLGSSYSFNSKFTLAGSLDYTQSSYTASDDSVSLTAFGSYRISNVWSANVMLGTDDTKTNLIGTSLNYRFN